MNAWAGAPPGWLLGHAQAYAELLAAESEDAWATWRLRCIWGAVALLAGLLGLALGGVALMLWACLPEPFAATPPGSPRWLLWATPLLPLCVSAAAVLRLSLERRVAPFAALRLQSRADWHSLQGQGQERA
jgi:hypothetical protein